MMGIYLITFAIFFWLEASHRSNNIQEKRITQRHEYQEVGLIEDYLRVYLPQRASLQYDLAESFHWTTPYASILKPFLGFLILPKNNIPIPCLAVVSLTASILRTKWDKGLEVSTIKT